MRRASTKRFSRPGLAGLTALALAFGWGLPAAAAGVSYGQGAQEHGGAAHGYAARPAPRGNQSRPNQSRPNSRPGQPHLGEWMSSHSNLPLAQQQHALEQEPGFQQLRPEVQQHMRDQLTRLNAMSPDQRDRAIARTEAMERLAPEQRQQVRGALAQLGSLPEDRRRAVARAFRDLRDLPEAQRQAYMNSPQFRSQFSDTERGTLNGLIGVAPFYPPLQRPAAPPPGPYGSPQPYAPPPLL